MRDQADRWRRAFEIMDSAVDLEDDELKSYLHGACGDDEALLEDVRSLLNADRRADDFLDAAAAERAAELIISSSERPADGRRFGAFRTVRPLGRGGMGVVFLAQRVEGDFEQEVAIKCLSGITGSPELGKRFREERQILAGLQHPSIAHLLDGGVSEDGIPYFAMEYVDGEPVTDYCNHHGLGLRERIRVFLDICAAVSHAHSKLVIHRDLKPSNILVSEVKGEGGRAAPRIKLLDFGIARIMDRDQPATKGEALALAYSQLLTPEFASPEQLRGESATTATDVYALGLLLYELLTGERAQPVQGLSTDDAISRICGGSPLPPSEVACGGVPIRNKQLKGDLDAIVMKAIAKAPESRYRSVEALAEDLLRFMRSEPVEARGDDRTYRLGKFVSRYRWAVGFSSAIVVLLAALTVITWQSNIRIREALDLAELEADKSRQIADFLKGLFEASDPNVAAGEPITVDDLLQRGTERISLELADQPELLSPLLYELAVIHEFLGDFDEETGLLEQNLRMLEDLPGDHRAEIARSLHRMSIATDYLGDFERSEQAGSRALSIREELYGRNHPDVAESLDRLASLYGWLGQYERALPLAREAVTILHETVPASDERAMTAGHNLAWLLARTRQYDESTQVYEDVIAISEQVQGPEHSELLLTLTSFASMLRAKGDVQRAVQVFRRVLDVQLRTLGEDHIDVAYTRNNLAKALQSTPARDEGTAQEIIELYQRAVDTFRNALGENHPNVGVTVGNLAQAYLRHGDLEMAETGFRDSIAIHRATESGDATRLAIVLLGLGEVLTRTDRFDEAESNLRESLAIYQESLPADHWQLAEAKLRLGQLLLKTGRAGEAQQVLQEAHDIFAEHFGPDHSLTVEALEALDLGLHVSQS